MSIRIDPPPLVIEVAKSVRARGGRALLIGGAVRDSVIGTVCAREGIKDFDLEVFGLAPALLREVLAQHGEVSLVGEAFGVFKLRDLDVSLPRREQKTGSGHRDFLIEGDPFMSIEEAARRRDLTVNSISFDPLTEELFDPFGGIVDITSGVLRMIDPSTFAEDPLRTLRIAQFVSRFSFTIDAETVRVARGLNLNSLPAERIREEMLKLLVRGTRPDFGLIALDALEVPEQLFPELLAIRGVPQNPAWHPEGAVDIHTQLVVKQARESEGFALLPDAEQISLMFAALCHDYGKATNTEYLDGAWRSHKHEEAGCKPTGSFLDRLLINRIGGYEVRKQVIALVANHLKPALFAARVNEVGDGAFRRLALKCDVRLLYLLSKADILGRGGRKRFAQAYTELPKFLERVKKLDLHIQKPAPILNGQHLIDHFGIPGSPAFGRILQAVFDDQLDGRVTSLSEALARAATLLPQYVAVPATVPVQ